MKAFFLFSDTRSNEDNLSIRITLLDDNNVPLSGYTVVLNSSPVFTTTDSNGNAVFAGASLSPHTFSVRFGMAEIGRYTLSFTKRSTNRATITGGGTGVNTTNNPNFLILNLTLTLNSARTSGLITDASIQERANQEENLPNPGYRKPCC